MTPSLNLLRVHKTVCAVWRGRQRLFALPPESSGRPQHLKQQQREGRGQALAFVTSAERELRVAGHSVRFVKDNQLHAGAEQPLRPRELLDLASHDVDASVVGGIELFHRAGRGEWRIVGGGGGCAGVVATWGETTVA